MGGLWYFIKKKQAKISQKSQLGSDESYVNYENILKNLKKGNEVYKNQMSERFGEDYIHNLEYNKFIKGILL